MCELVRHADFYLWSEPRGAHYAVSVCADPTAKAALLARVYAILRSVPKTPDALL
jgi:hypothetical protein